MRKLSAVLLIFVLSVNCFSAPNPGGKASIKDGVPSGSTPPSTIYKTSNVSKPLPTNKWFNSIMHNQHNSFSLKMFTYPQVFECYPEALYSKGFLISYPKVKYSQDAITFGYDSTAYAYPNNIKVSAYNSIANNQYLNFDSAKLDGYSDFCAAVKWEYGSQWMRAVFGQGFMFSYFEVENSVFPAFEFPYEWDSSYGRFLLYKPDGTLIVDNILNLYSGDRLIVETKFPDGNSVFYGVFTPAGTSFKQASTADNRNRFFLDLPSGQKYFSVGLLPSKNITEAVSDLAVYYKYAYNFITDTKVEWSVNGSMEVKTNFSITTTKKRTDIADQQNGTLFCLLPHQYDNISCNINYVNNKTFDTLRGTLKLAAGSNFSTTTKFKGMLPFFKYDIPGDIKSSLSAYLNSERNINMGTIPTNTYHGGKVIAKLANMLPIADNLNDEISKRSIIIKLRAELINWFTYSGVEPNKYFAYENIWGGLIGVDASYGSQDYNDHHFHYGYFIYAAALLAMYDETFAKDYGGMVELLIKDIANMDRNDANFPYMRNFDFYESHSWANGMGGIDNRGIDQESSSEAMNAWSAIYLWGVATNNTKYQNLGIFLYSGEYEAIKRYYFDINADILKSPYNHNSIGILWGGLVNYNLHFDPRIPQTIKGIQILPLTPQMTYLAYDKNYIENFYNASLYETGSKPVQWYDIWARLASLFNPSTALALFNNYKSTTDSEEGSSKTFTYHFLNFFNKYGTPITSYTADISSYLVTENASHKRTFCVYNPSGYNRTVRFYDSSNKYVGSMNVGAKSFALTSSLIQNDDETKFSVFPVPYKPQSGGKYDGQGITFSGLGENADIKIFNIAGEKVFDVSVDPKSNFYIWDAKNNYGQNIASGIYLYYIKSNGSTIKGKIAIER